MAISLKHNKVSGVSDGGDASKVQPSNWNEEHNLTLATDKLLGRATAGTGAVEEITCTAAGRALLDDADAVAQRTTLGVINTVDQPPTSPHADDDEFNSGSLNGSWTETLENSPTISINGTLPSCYMMKASTSNRSSILRKSVTVSDDGVWVAKFHAASQANFSLVHLGFFTSDLTNGMWVDWLYNSGLAVRLVSWDNSVATMRQQTTSLVVTNTMYLYLKRASNVWSYGFSYDGKSYFEPTGTHSKTFTIDKMEILLDGDAQTIPQRMAIDYIRRDSFTL